VKTIVIHEGVRTIGKKAFSGSGLESVTIPSTVNRIKEGTFRCCKQLERVVLLPQVQLIEKEVFCKCPSLKSVEIPASVTTICSDNFTFCKQLQNVVLSGGSPCIGADSFVNCYKLDSSDVISTGRMSFRTFQRLAKTNIARRLKSRSPDQKTIALDSLREVPDHIAPAPGLSPFVGLITQLMKRRLAQIHGLITYWELKDATSVLELAIWKTNLDDTAQTTELRQHRRQESGADMQIIMSHVLQFFDYNNNIN